MNVCIWWKLVDGPWGGGNSFLTSLGRELTGRGVNVTHKPSRSDDVVLMNAWNLGADILNSAGMVKEVKVRGASSRFGRRIPEQIWSLLPTRSVPMIHRVDGVAELNRGSKSMVDVTQFAVNALSDYTIFQSRFCQESFGDFGDSPPKWSIAYNGVDGDVFFQSDAPRKSGPFRIGASSWSSNRRKGFDALAEISEIEDVELHFFGNWCPEVDQKQVVNHGPTTSPELAESLRGMDAFAHAAKNETSSNSILEALASGLPVMYLDSGGNRELAGDFGFAFGENLTETVEQTRENLKSLQLSVAAGRDRFLIGQAADAYMQVFSELIG